MGWMQKSWMGKSLSTNIYPYKTINNFSNASDTPVSIGMTFPPFITVKFLDGNVEVLLEMCFIPVPILLGKLDYVSHMATNQLLPVQNQIVPIPCTNLLMFNLLACGCTSAEDLQPIVERIFEAIHDLLHKVESRAVSPHRSSAVVLVYGR